MADFGRYHRPDNHGAGKAGPCAQMPGTHKEGAGVIHWTLPENGMDSQLRAVHSGKKCCLREVVAQWHKNSIKSLAPSRWSAEMR